MNAATIQKGGLTSARPGANPTGILVPRASDQLDRVHTISPADESVGGMSDWVVVLDQQPPLIPAFVVDVDVELQVLPSERPEGDAS
jgi:hypothetical protein